jgi:hypothetical protein
MSNFIPGQQHHMESKEEEKNEKTFTGFGKKVDQFLDELNEAGEKLQKEFQQRYEELKTSAEKMKKEAENKERWKEVEASLKKAGDELSKAFKAAFKKNESK